MSDSDSGSSSSNNLEVLNPKVSAVRTALRNRDPFYTGICTIGDHQSIVYYTDGELHRRIDFSNARTDELDALYHACKPTDSGRIGESVLDAAYRRAGKIDLTSFSTLFDPLELGIYQQVSKALLPESHARMELKLDELNVYGKGDFFKAHNITLRGVNMFGSLVVVLPTMHEGGQLAFSQAQKEWTINVAEDLASAKEPSAYFIAFYSDLEFEVLPVTSGYCVTLTYNLYKLDNKIDTDTRFIPTPFHVNLQESLCELVNDKTTLPDGGYLGFGLVHQYPHMENNLLDPLPGQLKGADRAIMDVCDTLGLDYSFRMFYKISWFFELDLLSTFPLDISNVYTEHEDPGIKEYLDELLLDGKFKIEDVEGVLMVGKTYDANEFGSGLESVCRDPVTEVLEVTRMSSSVSHTSSAGVLYKLRIPGVEHLHGSACLVVALDPVETRQVIQVKS